MARIRSIKPDAFRSESLSSVPRGARWTFAGLWTYVDDAGRGIYNPRLIWSDLYPLDEDTTPNDVKDDLKDLESVGAIVLYEVDGKTYFYIPAWFDHQAASFRRGDSHLPEPPETNTLHDSACKDVQESAVSRRGEEKERRGTGSVARATSARINMQTPATPTDDELPPVFITFTETYPGNVSTKPALAAWISALKRTKGNAERIIAGATAYADWVTRSGTEPKFVRNAVKWLNEDGWRDELKSPSRASPRSTTDQRVTDALEVANRLRAEEADQPPTPKAIGR